MRTANVEAAQWSPNGGALGQADLTQPGANVFGENVFSVAVQRQRLPKAVFRQLQATIAKGEPLEPALADAVASAMKEWAMEQRRDPLHALVPAADRLDRREARLVLRARPATATRSPSSPARSSSRASRTRRRSRPAASARRSRPAATPPGTRPRRRSSSRTPTARCSASRPRSRRGRARRSTTRSRCCARWTRCRSGASARCGCSATTTPSASSPRSAPSRSTS